MVVISEEKVVFKMDKDNKSVVSVKSGDRVIFKTKDCFSGSVRKTTDLVSQIDFSQVNPATGPLYVEDAKEGDTLKIYIEKIKLDKQAAAVCLPKFGVLGDKINQEMTIILDIDEEKNTAKFLDKNLELKKMIGVIGTAPKNIAVETATPDSHGGNMDVMLIGEGTILYLPVNVDGALLSLGDLHALMGDGEVSGSGAEVAGEVQLRVEVLKERNYSLPMFEYEDKIVCVGCDEDMYKASQIATENMVRYLMTKNNLSFEENTILLSLVGNLRVCQAVNPKFSMRMEISKKYI